MFSATKKTASSHPEANAPTIVGHGTTIQGDLTTFSEVQIDGAVEGDIVAGKVLICERADIKGNISAEEIVIRGGVQGRLRGRMVELARTARVVGDICHESVAIEAGAHVDGVLKHAAFAPAGDETPAGERLAESLST